MEPTDPLNLLKTEQNITMDSASWSETDTLQSEGLKLQPGSKICQSVYNNWTTRVDNSQIMYVTKEAILYTVHMEVTDGLDHLDDQQVHPHPEGVQSMDGTSRSLSDTRETDVTDIPEGSHTASINKHDKCLSMMDTDHTTQHAQAVKTEPLDAFFMEAEESSMSEKKLSCRINDVLSPAIKTEPQVRFLAEESLGNTLDGVNLTPQTYVKKTPQTDECFTHDQDGTSQPLINSSVVKLEYSIQQERDADWEQDSELSEGEIEMDPSPPELWYQCSKYQPIVMLGRLPDGVDKGTHQANLGKSGEPDKGSSQPSQVKSDEKTHMGDQRFICGDGGVDFVSRPILNKHFLMHKNEQAKRHEVTQTTKKTFSCEFCQKTFSVACILKRHQRTHTGNMPIFCDVSQTKCSSESNLNTHHLLPTGEKPFSCNVCQKKFCDGSSLNKHQRIHTGEKPFSCKVCRKRFSDRSNLSRHLRTHTGEKPFSCHICQKKFTSRCHVKRHQQTHSVEKSFSCKVCQKNFASAYDVKRHQRIHTKTLFYCKVCDKKFFRMSAWTRHQQIHTGEKPFSCKFCPKKFSFISTLNIHQRIHTGEKPFSCNVCQKKFCTGSSLKRHQRIHTGEKPFSCNVCEKRFSEGSALIIHQRIHTGEKPFSCNVCQKKFSEGPSLKRHQRIHTGEKPFSCKVCEKRFSHRVALRRHLRTHTGEKPFCCDICQKKFTRICYLKTHLLVHFGEKPFCCAMCQKKFTRQKSLKVHELKHTSQKPFSCDLSHSKFRYESNL